METTTHSDERLLVRLKAHPEIKQRIGAMLAVVEDAGGDLKLADAAELRQIEEIRRLGLEAMQAWAERQVEQTAQQVRQSGRAHRDGKKNFAGTPRLET